MHRAYSPADQRTREPARPNPGNAGPRASHRLGLALAEAKALTHAARARDRILL
jgi:hypothetical protein